MKTTHFLMSVLAAAGLAAGVCAAENPEGKQTVQQNGPTRLSALRLLTAATPGSAWQNWMTAGAWKRWNDIFGGMIFKNGKAPLLSDFFGNAIQMTGPQLETSGVTGFYNPYQDTLLLIQTDNSDRIPRIEDFVFLSGPQFRGEKLADGQYAEVLAPRKAPLDALLAANITEVRTIFEREFPKDAKNISLGKYRSVKPDVQVKSFTDNATLHLLRLLSLFDAAAKPDLLQVGKYSAILWEGDLQKIKETFAFPGDDAATAEAFVKLDKEVRSSLLPCVYFRNKHGMLLGLASRLHPDFVILISAPEKAGPKPLFAFIPFRQEILKDLCASR
ncbi:MAG: hypothetical protein IJS14_09785 [Lentisphaeria bacterium]|nr:hypothetical protein [Lentisphaeria bacterium]